jgi:hypothetical protein
MGAVLGEPVDAVTGEVLVEQADFTLPGRIPLACTCPIPWNWNWSWSREKCPPFIMDDPLFMLDYTIFLFYDVMSGTSVRFSLAASAFESSL